MHYVSGIGVLEQRRWREAQVTRGVGYLEPGVFFHGGTLPNTGFCVNVQIWLNAHSEISSLTESEIPTKSGEYKGSIYRKGSRREFLEPWLH